MSALSAEGSRLIAVLLAILAAFSAYTLAIEPALGGYLEHRQAVAQGRAKLVRLEALATSADRLDRSLVQRRQEALSDAALLDAGAPSVAAARLQDRVKRAVQSVGGDLRSAQVLRAEAVSAYVRVGLTIDVAAPASVLPDLLHALETNEPLLVLDDLTIRTSQVRAVEPVVDPPAIVRLNVYGFVAGARDEGG